MADLERYYDLFAEKIAEEWYPNEMLFPTLRDFLSLLPDGPTVLDLGCGPGHESGRLRSLGASVVGIDLSGKSIEIAKARNPECVFHKMDFYEIDPAIGPFDGVLASGSLIHAPPGRLSKVLSRVEGVLVRNGIFAAIIRDGRGEIVRRHDVDGHQLEWRAYLYCREGFSEYCRHAGMRFEREGCVDDRLRAMGWRCYFYKRGQAK